MSERTPQQWTGEAPPGFHPLGVGWDDPDLAGLGAGNVCWPGERFSHQLENGSETTMCGIPIPDNASGWGMAACGEDGDCPICLEALERWQEEGDDDEHT